MVARQRIEQQAVYVLHAHPWRETSLVVEMFSRQHGRLPMVAKGARRAGSAFRGVLMAFQPLLADWSGGGEVRTLARVEWCGGMALLAGRGLLCGYYLNELLIRLLPREDAHPELFDDYAAALAELSAGGPPDRCLRRFELALLRGLGYAPELSLEAESWGPVREEGRYHFIIERGLVPCEQAPEGAALTGRALLDMHSGAFAEVETLQQAKQLFRQLINHHLGGQALQSRRVFTELQEL